MDELKIPIGLRSSHGDWSWSLVWSYMPEVATWRLTHADGRTRYLKVGRLGRPIPIRQECERMSWARDHLPVPEVLDCGADGNVEWMLTAALPGRDATTPELKADPRVLATLLAQGLRRFHEAPVNECPG